MRVTQQQECYAAETVLGIGDVFTDVTAAQTWVDNLRNEHWWHLQGYSLAVLRIEVGSARGNSIGWYEKEKSAGRIELASSQLNKVTVIHEVAHILAMSMHGSKTHDPAWARTYLTLVSCVLGPDDYLKLKGSFDEHGVNYDVTPKSSGVFAL